MAKLVTFYTRPGCALCDDVREDLRLLEAERDIDVREMDITSGPDLLTRFEHLIPVVDVEGGALLTPPISLYQLRKAIES